MTLLWTCMPSPCISVTVRDGIPWIRTRQSYMPAFEVTTGVNCSGIVYAVPSLVCIPDVPPSGTNHVKVTFPTTSLSTTTSLQVMLKSSPAIGLPGTVTASLKRSRVRSIEYTCTWTHIIKHQNCHFILSTEQNGLLATYLPPSAICLLEHCSVQWTETLMWVPQWTCKWYSSRYHVIQRVGWCAE